MSVFVVLIGAFQFFSDLNESLARVRAIRKPTCDEEDVILQYNFHKVSSYKNTESLGKDNVQVFIGEQDVKDKNILVVEDIYDTGNSMMAILKRLEDFGAKSVKVCVLLHKKNPANLEYNWYADYIGFYIPCKFVIGYGMDLNEYMRDMKHLCIISKEGIDKYKV